MRTDSRSALPFSDAMTYFPGKIEERKVCLPFLQFLIIICEIALIDPTVLKRKLRILLTMPKPLTVWITTNYGKFLKRWEYQTTLPASWEICMQVKKQELEPDMEHRTGSKLGKEYVKAVYCHPAYLTYIQNTSWETLGWRKHKLE